MPECTEQSCFGVSGFWGSVAGSTVGGFPRLGPRVAYRGLQPHSGSGRHMH